jgi:hypothetical protein
MSVIDNLKISVSFVMQHHASASGSFYFPVLPPSLYPHPLPYLLCVAAAGYCDYCDYCRFCVPRRRSDFHYSPAPVFAVVF